MIPVQNLQKLPREEISELLTPIFSYTLAEAPVQQREALVDKICEVLLEETGTARAPTNR